MCSSWLGTRAPAQLHRTRPPSLSLSQTPLRQLSARSPHTLAHHLAPPSQEPRADDVTAAAAKRTCQREPLHPAQVSSSGRAGPSEWLGPRQGAWADPQRLSPTRQFTPCGLDGGLDVFDDENAAPPSVPGGDDTEYWWSAAGQQVGVHRCKSHANRDVGDFGWEVAHAAVSRRPPIPLDGIVARTRMYTHDAKVWALSRTIFCRPVPNPNRYRFATFASLHEDDRVACCVRGGAQPLPWPQPSSLIHSRRDGRDGCPGSHFGAPEQTVGVRGVVGFQAETLCGTRGAQAWQTPARQRPYTTMPVSQHRPGVSCCGGCGLEPVAQVERILEGVNTHV
jgi:hypothetical protein